MQGGDFENRCGTGGRSIYGGKFDDEGVWLPHTEKYLLSMANAGKNTNGSQFFVTFEKTPHLDGKHTVFGRVIDGFDVIQEVEKVKTLAQDKPAEDVVITNCGEVKANNDSKEWKLSAEEKAIVEESKAKKAELTKKKEQMKVDAQKRLENVANEEVDDDDPFGLGDVDFGAEEEENPKKNSVDKIEVEKKKSKEWELSAEEKAIVEESKKKKEVLNKKKEQMKIDAQKRLEDVANQEVDEDDPFGLGEVNFD